MEKFQMLNLLVNVHDDKTKENEVKTQLFCV